MKSSPPPRKSTLENVGGNSKSKQLRVSDKQKIKGSSKDRKDKQKTHPHRMLKTDATQSEGSKDTVIIRSPNDAFSSLGSSREVIHLYKDRKFAYDLAQLGRKAESREWKDFFRLPPPAEKYAPLEYTVGMNRDYCVSMHHHENVWFLYRLYDSFDKLTSLDIFEEQMNCVRLMPKLFPNKDDQSVFDIKDFISCAPVLRYEWDRRQEAIEGRLTPRDARGAPMMKSYRKALGKQERRGLRLWPHLIAEQCVAIRQSMNHRILHVENALRHGRMQKTEAILNFKRFNSEWWEQRKSMFRTRSQIFLKRKDLGRFIAHCPFRQYSLHEITSELHRMPAFFGHSIHFCRVLKNMHIVGHGEMFRKLVGNQLIPIRVQMPLYQNKCSAIGAVKLEAEVPYPTVSVEVSNRAPSLNSLSGFSTGTGVSTATVSPGDWQHNWKTQTNHADMEHRLMESGVQNEAEERRLGEIEYSVRIGDEIEKRINMISDLSRLDYLLPFLCPSTVDSNNTKKTDKFRLTREKWQLNASLRRLEDLHEAYQNTTDKNEKQILAFAYTEELRHLPLGTDSQDEYQGLGINGSWMCAIDSGKIQSKERRILSYMVSSQHTWVPCSSFSQVSTINRCDKQLIPQKKRPVFFMACILIAIICILLALTLFVFVL